MTVTHWIFYQCRSVDELGKHITTLEDGWAEKEQGSSKRQGDEEGVEKGGEENLGLEGSQEERMDVDVGTRKDGQVFSPLPQSRRPSRGRRRTGKKRMQKEVMLVKDGGCLVCGKDNDYRNVSVCWCVFSSS